MRTDPASDLQDALASAVVYKSVDPRNQVLRLMDQPLLLFFGKGVNVASRHPTLSVALGPLFSIHSRRCCMEGLTPTDAGNLNSHFQKEGD